MGALNLDGVGVLCPQHFQRIVISSTKPVISILQNGIFSALHLYALAAYILYFTIDNWLRTHRLRQFAFRNGCEDPPHNSLNKWPWSLDAIYRLITAVSRGKDILDDLIVPSFAREKAGTIYTAALGGGRAFATMDPRNLQAMLTTQFEDYGTGDRRNKQLKAMLGDNIFTGDGEFWAHSRAVFRPMFSREQINDLEETERAAGILIDVLPPPGVDGWTAELNLMPLFYRFTLDTATSFIMGQTADSQLAAAGRLVAKKGSATDMASRLGFVEAFTVGQEWLTWRIRLQGFYWLVQSPRWWKATRDARKFVNHYVQLALERQAEEKRMGRQLDEKDGKKKYNLLRELAEDCADPVELRDQLLGILAAGRDSTASLLSFTFIELARRNSRRSSRRHIRDRRFFM